jgi:hypothetical protein
MSSVMAIVFFFFENKAYIQRKFVVKFYCNFTAEFLFIFLYFFFSSIYEAVNVKGILFLLL